VKINRPELPVLLTSGYCGTWLGDRLEREVRLIQKPYTQDEVLRQIRRLLGARPGGIGPTPQEVRA